MKYLLPFLAIVVVTPASAQMTRNEAATVVRELAPHWTVRDIDPFKTKWFTVYIPEKKDERTWLLQFTRPEAMRKEILETLGK